MSYQVTISTRGKHLNYFAVYSPQGIPVCRIWWEPFDDSGAQYFCSLPMRHHPIPSKITNSVVLTTLNKPSVISPSSDQLGFNEIIQSLSPLIYQPQITNICGSYLWLNTRKLEAVLRTFPESLIVMCMMLSLFMIPFLLLTQNTHGRKVIQLCSTESDRRLSIYYTGIHNLV